MIIVGFPKLFPTVTLVKGDPPRGTRRTTVSKSGRTDGKGKGDGDGHGGRTERRTDHR